MFKHKVTDLTFSIFHSVQIIRWNKNKGPFSIGFTFRLSLLSELLPTRKLYCYLLRPLGEYMKKIRRIKY